MMNRKFVSKKPKFAQRDLFGQTLKSTYLFSPDSSKKAFYALSLEFEFGQYLIKKQSGFGDKVLDRRRWVFDTLSDAEKSFDRRVKQKTRSDRKSPRHYIEISPEYGLHPGENCTPVKPE